MVAFLSSRRTKGFALAAFVLLALLVGLFVFRTIQTKRERAALLQTPAPADLSVPPPDSGEDPEQVPSFKEAMGYINLCRRRSLTVAEINRVFELARDRHYGLTSGTAMVVLTSINAPDQRDRILALLCENLKNPQSHARVIAIGSLGNMKDEGKAALLLPLLNSPNKNEREHAEIALKKLGYKMKKS